MVLEVKRAYGVFTPEQDDKTTTRQMLNLCIPMMPFTPGLSCRCWTWCERHHRNAKVQHLSCRCLVNVLLWCENTIRGLLKTFNFGVKVPISDTSCYYSISVTNGIIKTAKDLGKRKIYLMCAFNTWSTTKNSHKNNVSMLLQHFVF